MDMFLFLFVLMFVLGGTQQTHWSSTSPQDGSFLYVCTNLTSSTTLPLPWSYTLSPEDLSGDIHWFFRNDSSQQMLAVSYQDNFLPLPAFAHLVGKTPHENAGILLKNLTVGDSGKYSVEVYLNRRDDASGDRSVLRRSVYVQITDGLMTPDGRVHVSQSADAVLDNATDQWSLQLTCGPFTFRGPPAFHVEWITPSQELLASTDYTDQHFHLLLPNPVKGGNYTCRVPFDHVTDACLHDDQLHLGEATVHVDSVSARLSLLEMENKKLIQDLKRSQTQLVEDELLRIKIMNQSTELADIREEMAYIKANYTADLAQLNHELVQLKENHDAELAKVNDDFRLWSGNLSVRLMQLSHDLAQTRNEAHQQRQQQHVSFHTTGLLTSAPEKNTPLIFNILHHNNHGAYDTTTGYFTAPLPGVYFFTTTTGCDTPDTSTFHSLNVDGNMVGGGYSYCDRNDRHYLASVQAVVSLRAGQKVWVGSFGYRYEGGIASSFSGFFVAGDP